MLQFPFFLLEFIKEKLAIRKRVIGSSWQFYQHILTLNFEHSLFELFFKNFLDLSSLNCFICQAIGNYSDLIGNSF